MRCFIATLVVFVVLACGSANAAIARQEATATPPAALEDQLCEMEFNDGALDFGMATENDETAPPDAGIVVAPPGAAGIVTPVIADTLRLYPVVITLPPGACVPFHEIAGAAVLFVQEGTIAYIVHSDAEFAPGVLTGQLNIDFKTLEVRSGTPLFLGPGGWVTQDQRMWFTYRNVGYTDAVITMAALVDPAGLDAEGDPDGGIGGCNGGCRKH